MKSRGSDCYSASFNVTQMKIKPVRVENKSMFYQLENHDDKGRALVARMPTKKSHTPMYMTVNSQIKVYTEQRSHPLKKGIRYS